MSLHPRIIEQNDLREWQKYLHEHGLVGTVKKTSLGYHAQINLRDSPKQINENDFSSVDGQHVILSFEDLKLKAIVGDFVFDVTETGRVYTEPVQGE